MVNAPIPWAILELVQTRLRTVRRANDYRTDAGRDVRLEPAPFDPNDAPRLTLYPLTSAYCFFILKPATSLNVITFESPLLEGKLLLFRFPRITTGYSKPFDL